MTGLWLHAISHFASSPQAAPPHIAGLENTQTCPVEIATLRTLVLHVLKLLEHITLYYEPP